MQIDLMKVLPERVMVGFSTGTGQYVERHILKSWEFNSSLEKVETKGKIARRMKILMGSVVPVSFVIAVTVLSFIICKSAPLSWAVRYRISLGLAYALLYLHEEWKQCVVHRNIKSNNVLLDSNFNVKLGDFGLARLMDHELGPKTTGLAGTIGYMAPKYISTGRASKESDAYNFGVVLLEIATERKSTHRIENFEMGLVAWVWDLYGQGKLLLAIDKKLNNDVDGKQVKCLMTVGLWRAHPDSS
ncbi:hypothetical protein PTKIN_Ptkin08bG0132700 [Pterospermum kingtungense]